MKLLRNHILLMFPGIFLSLFVAAQSRKAFSDAEAGLKSKLDSIRISTDDSTRIRIHSRFLTALDTLLALPASFDYPFDSLKSISIVSTDDGRIRLLTWNLPMANGEHRWFGIIQDGDPKSFRVIRLTDRSGTMEGPSRAALTADNWFGARYYQVISCKAKDGSQFYTLLGWHGINLQVCARVIDILVAEPGQPVRFGLPVFCGDDPENPFRIIYQYSANASMVLSYEEQQVTGAKKWNPRKRAFESLRQKHPMIIADRLVPLDPQMEGQYEYYVPASDIQDGYIFQEGCWTLIKEVDARNRSEKKLN